MCICLWCSGRSDLSLIHKPSPFSLMYLSHIPPQHHHHDPATPSAVYWSFRMAVAQGYINLASKSASTDIPVADACLHAPPADFKLGDDTNQPTGAPVVYYWIPPMPTAAPTFEPTQPTSLLANPRWLAFIIVCVFIAGAVMFVAVRHTGGGYTAINQQSVELGRTAAVQSRA